MIHVRMKPMTNTDAAGWYTRLLALGKGYKSTSRRDAFGTTIHLVKLGDARLDLKQGSSRSLRTEINDTCARAQEIILDLTEVGALFPVTEASSWSL